SAPRAGAAGWCSGTRARLRGASPGSEDTAAAAAQARPWTAGIAAEPANEQRGVGLSSPAVRRRSTNAQQLSSRGRSREALGRRRRPCVSLLAASLLLSSSACEGLLDFDEPTEIARKPIDVAPEGPAPAPEQPAPA